MIKGTSQEAFLSNYAAFVAELHKGTVTLYVPDLGNTYSGSGYFGNGSGTYKAEGDMIYTYIDGEELYRYKVHSISNGIAEVSMGVAGDNITLEIKLQKSNQIGYMFQNKGENKSRLCYSLQNHYICIAKSKCDTNISNHIGYFVSIHTVKFNCVEFGSGNARRLAF